MDKKHFIGIIPARYASVRLPGKPLAAIGDKPMIRWVFEAVKTVLDTVYVATDDDRIKQAVEQFGGKAVMTSATHPSGTDRCYEAATIIRQTENQSFDIVINIQGDEPFLQPGQLNTLMNCFTDPRVDIATLATRFNGAADIHNPNHAKIVRDKYKFALYFSRSAIPYIRGHEVNEWSTLFPFVKHIGIYAYRMETLKQLVDLQPSSLEMAERLEQNRWLENGFRIKVEDTVDPNLSVDTPEDLEKANALIRKK